MKTSVLILGLLALGVVGGIGVFVVMTPSSKPVTSSPEPPIHRAGDLTAAASHQTPTTRSGGRLLPAHRMPTTTTSPSQPSTTTTSTSSSSTTTSTTPSPTTIATASSESEATSQRSAQSTMSTSSISTSSSSSESSLDSISSNSIPESPELSPAKSNSIPLDTNTNFETTTTLPSSASPSTSSEAATTTTTTTTTSVPSVASTSESPEVPAGARGLHESPADTPPAPPTNNFGMPGAQDPDLRFPPSFEDRTEPELAGWMAFKAAYRKVYANPDESLMRQSIFLANLRYINQFNRLSGAQYVLGMNHFGDLTRDEINNHFVGPSMNWTHVMSRLHGPVMPMLAPGEPQQPVAHKADWRNVTSGPPPDQGTCRDSAVFAAVANIEAAFNLHMTGSATVPAPVKLSEGQVLECMRASSRSGDPPLCSGYLSMIQVYQQFQQHPGLLATQEAFLQAQSRAMQSGGPAPALCEMLVASADASDAASAGAAHLNLRAHLSSHGLVHPDNIGEALQTVGPLTIALDASQSTFHFYKSGVYHELACSTEQHNLHMVLVGVDDTPAPTGHYLARVSFGLDWGELGHIKLARDPKINSCLPHHLAIYPTVALAQ